MNVRLVLATALVALGCGQPFFQFSTPKPPPEPPFPRSVSPTEIQAVSFRRTRCFGQCPHYSFLIRRDGSAVYCGLAFVNILGAYQARVDSTTFDQLTRLLVRKGFFGLRRNYSRPVTDQASVITEAILADTSKTVVNYGDYAPSSLGVIEAAIDSVGARLPWDHAPDSVCAAT
jgi:uncharacterized protein DUF6438